MNWHDCLLTLALITHSTLHSGIPKVGKIKSKTANHPKSSLNGFSLDYLVGAMATLPARGKEVTSVFSETAVSALVHM